MRLPSDMVLRFDAGFRAISTTYANSLAAFNTAFAGAFGAPLGARPRTAATRPVAFAGSLADNSALSLPAAVALVGKLLELGQQGNLISVPVTIA